MRWKRRTLLRITTYCSTSVDTNNDLLVPKTMESCILKTKQTKTKKTNPKQNRTKTKTKNE